jgi:hypothetical protein
MIIQINATVCAAVNHRGQSQYKIAGNEQRRRGREERKGPVTREARNYGRVAETPVLQVTTVRRCLRLRLFKSPKMAAVLVGRNLLADQAGCPQLATSWRMRGEAQQLYLKPRHDRCGSGLQNRSPLLSMALEPAIQVKAPGRIVPDAPPTFSCPAALCLIRVGVARFPVRRRCSRCRALALRGPSGRQHICDSG